MFYGRFVISVLELFITTVLKELSDNGVLKMNTVQQYLLFYFVCSYLHMLLSFNLFFTYQNLDILWITRPAFFSWCSPGMLEQVL